MITGVQLIPKIHVPGYAVENLSHTALNNERAITLFAPVSLHNSVMYTHWLIPVQLHRVSHFRGCTKSMGTFDRNMR